MQLKFLWKFHILACVICVFCLAISNTVLAQNVYEKQSPITDKELTSFIQILPQFRAWAIAQKEQAHPEVVQGKADFVYSDAAKKWVQAHNWDPRRFFSVMGKAAAGIYIISEGGAQAKRSSDMPNISQGELNLIQKYLTQLLEAGKGTAPMKQ